VDRGGTEQRKERNVERGGGGDRRTKRGIERGEDKERTAVTTGVEDRPQGLVTYKAH